MNKSTLIIVFIVVVLAVGAGAFYGGMVYGKSQATPATPEELIAQLRERGGLPGGGQFAGRQGQNATGAVTGGLGGTAGTIESIDGNTLIISTNDGPVKVLASDTTLIEMTKPASVSELALGSSVIVAGSRNDDGSITARSIQPMRQIQRQQTGGGQ